MLAYARIPYSEYDYYEPVLYFVWSIFYAYFNAYFYFQDEFYIEMMT